MRDKETRKQAEVLRRKGYSYTMIAEQLGVPKGTLHWWLRDIPFSPNQYARLKRKQGFAHSAASRAAQTRASGEAARLDAKNIVGKLSDRDALMAGIGLLLNRSLRPPRGAVLRTSSLEVARFIVLWFQKTLGVAPDHFAPFIQISSERDYKPVLRQWAEATGIPPDQFATPRFTKATSVKAHAKSRDYGAFYLAFRGCGKRHFKVDLEQRIQGFRDALLNED